MLKLEPIIESVVINETEITVIERQSSNEILLSNPPQQSPDVLLKKVYAVVDGKICLVHTVIGHSIKRTTVKEDWVWSVDC